MSNKKRYLYLSMLAALTIALLTFFYLGIFPFGDKTIVTGDLGGQYINFYTHYSSAINSGQWSGIIYGFDKSLGGPLIGNLAYYCTSIFNMLYLAFSPDKYPLVVTVIYILKVVRASGTMCFYLNEKYDSLNIYSILLSICYSYCAFSTVYYQNIMWFDAMILLPVVAYGIEKLVKGNSVAVYIISLFLTIISNFYTGYMVCIFCVIYFIYEIIVTKSKTVISNFKNFFLSSLTAGGMSAFLIIPMFFDVLKAKGVGSGISLTFTNAFKFSEFFYKLFPFNFSWQEVHNGLPNVYTGLICLCGIALFIASKNITLKEKITSSAVVVILF